MRLCFHIFAAIVGLTLFASHGFTGSQLGTTGASFASYQIGQGQIEAAAYDVVQDQEGFIWVGTAQGLHRFDGYRFERYPAEPRNLRDVRVDLIRDMAMDKAGRIWLGTAGGLSLFDTRTLQRTTPVDLIEVVGNARARQVWALDLDQHGRVWLGTEAGAIVYDPQTGATRWFDLARRSLPSETVWSLMARRDDVLLGTDFGLCSLDPETGQVTPMAHETAGGSGKKRILSMFQARGGRLWLGTGAGPVWFDQDQGLIRDYRPNQQRRQGLNVCRIRAIHQDSRGGLWLAADGRGLYFLAADGEDFVHYNGAADGQTGPSSGRIFAMFEDNRNGLWFAGESGVDRLEIAGDWFRHYSNDPGNAESLSSSVVTAVLLDSRDHLWVGSRGGGLNAAGTDRSSFQHFFAESDQANGLPSNHITALVEDHRGRIWVGTDQGLGRFDPATDTFLPSALEGRAVSDLMVDEGNALWVGTSTGLFRLDGDGVNAFTADAADDGALSSNLVRCLFQDRHRRYWVGTENGFHQWDPQTGRFVRFQHDRRDPTSISGGLINGIGEDNHGRIWLATSNGLNRMNPVNGAFKVYGMEEGLPSDNVLAVCVDHGGRLWLATDDGLSCFNPLMEVFQNYGVNDGLQHRIFHPVSFKAADGEMFFGGVNGLNSFYPDALGQKKSAPPVALTNLYILNRMQGVDSDVLNQPIHLTQKLDLDHTHDLVTFEFSALNYDQPHKNRYAYKLEGLDREWIYTDASNRQASYSNLPAGAYRFRVKAADPSGTWRETGTALGVTVMPPPWLSWWAYLSYGLAALFLLVYYMRAQQLKLKREREMAALERRMADQAREMAEADRRVAEKERETAAHLRQVDKLKDEFLANTSHELRTPLNAIIGLAESLCEGIAGDLPPKAIHNLGMISNSGKRLASLVDDILDFSKLKNHALALHRGPVDLHILTDVIISLCRPLAQHKSLDFINGVPADLPFVEADENRLQQILFNLVGNAVKFTCSGSIVIEAEPVAGKVVVRVIDTGPGIDEMELERIFKPFEQGDGSISRQHGGTGLGLAVTRQLLQLHGGRLDVTSAKGVGSTFSFTLPIATGRPETRTDPIPDRDQIESIVGAFADMADALSGETDKTLKPAGARAATILLVDDDGVNLQVLSDFLTPLGYGVLIADHGEKALEMIENQRIDLVLLDVMMPHVSGYEICARIRTRFTAEQLPVLFLSARNQVWDMARGYEMGANDYLTKPVTKRELLPRIQTHLRIQEVRRRLAKAQRDARDGAKAGLEARFASVVIHNIANVIQSLVISCEQAHLHLRKARGNNPLADAKALLSDEDVVDLLSGDPRGRKVMDALGRAAVALDEQYGSLEVELAGLLKKTDLVVEIIQERQRRSREAVEGCEVLDLNAVVEEILKTQEPFLDQSGVAVKCGFGQVEEIEGKKLHVDHILINLIKNAVEAMADHPRGDRRLHLVTGVVDGYGFVRLRDNGPGIPAASRKKIFEHGYTTKRQGSGFGLPYCQKMMEQMGGRIVLEPNTDGGAVFTLYFPPAGREKTCHPKPLKAVGH